MTEHLHPYVPHRPLTDHVGRPALTIAESELQDEQTQVDVNEGVETINDARSEVVVDSKLGYQGTRLAGQ